MTIRLNGQTSGYVELEAPATAGSNTLVLPTNNGTSGQYLQTNGSGALSWQTVASLSNAQDGTGTDFQFNSGYGSVATAYGVRAWVQFQGSNGTINASGNVSSVTRTTTGQYYVNFTNSMPDDDYAAVCSSKGSWNLLATHTIETGRVQILAVNQSFNYADHTFISVVIVR